MTVEFIGSTGAGKTTLISKLQRRLVKTTEVTTPFDLIAAPLGLRDVNHTTAQNLIQELIGLPFFIRSLPRHKAFVSFTLKMLARQANFSFLTISNLRSLERKLGMYEIIRRYKRDRMVLVDEGTVLTAHNVFVFTSVVYTPEEIARFASLIPLPDVIVYVRAPLESLIKRSLERSDRRRELESKDRALIEKYLNRAVALFEQLVEVEEIRNRVLIVENPESADKGCETVVDYISESLLNYKTADRCV
jgi:thymidylate kinase